MIDLHFHILPGIDDGPADEAQMLALAAAAVEAGTTTVVATPHVNWEYRNTAEGIAARVDETNRALEGAGVSLRVVRGAEIAATLALDMSDEDLTALSLGGAGWLLIECPHTPAADGFDSIVFELVDRGHRVVLAHPERCTGLARHPEVVERLVQIGVATSVTAGSYAGRFGKTVQEHAWELAKRGIVHNVSSDAHGGRRSPELREAMLQAGLGDHLERLASATPRAILSGERPPAAEPMGANGGKPWWRRR